MKIPTFRKILYPIEFAVYITLFIISLLNICGYVSIYSYIQAKTVAITSGVGSVVILLPGIVELISKKRVSPFIDILLCVDFFCSIFLGEGCQVYLNFVGWDKILHFFGTAELSLLGYVLAKMLLDRLQPSDEKTKTKNILALFFGFFFSVTFESMWEVYEFTMDSTIGTNMQKYVPESYYDLISADGILDMPADEIVAFFSTSDGYTYALQDTMFDIITDVGGGLFGCLTAGIVFHFKPEWQDNLIFIREKDDAAPAVVNDVSDPLENKEDKSDGKDDFD